MRANCLIKVKKIVSTHDNVPPEMVGRLLNPIEVGLPIVLLGNEQDPDWGGYLRTTKVQKVEGNRYHTKNSVYEITEVPEQ